MFAKHPPETIIYVYTLWQAKCDEMQSLVDFFIQDDEYINIKIQPEAKVQPVLVVVDDLINSELLH